VDIRREAIPARARLAWRGPPPGGERRRHHPDLAADAGHENVQGDLVGAGGCGRLQHPAKLVDDCGPTPEGRAPLPPRWACAGAGRGGRRAACGMYPFARRMFVEDWAEGAGCGKLLRNERPLL
jgi:hypothetical protein